jgi:CheY-like chemotaxis protein
MESQNANQHAEEPEAAARRTIHDVAAALISIRALAETLADHVPVLIAVSRSRHSFPELGIPNETLDALPSLPTEIVGLCELASRSLASLGRGAVTEEKAWAPVSGSRRTPVPVGEETQGRLARVLLVEDEDTVRYVLSETLREAGCAVTGVCDGNEALQRLQSGSFDLILMDLRIPGMSGWETASLLRERERRDGRHVPIIGLTASPLLEDQRSAKAAGMDEVIVKPVDEDELRSILDRYT